jgi:hypothetical protein
VRPSGAGPPAVPRLGLPEQLAYRIADWDTPLWARANPAGSRFNRPRSGPIQYLSLHPLGPWAEVFRVTERQLGREVRAADLELQRHRLWVLRLPEVEVLDLDFESARVVGLEPLDLVDDRHDACQAAGERYGQRESGLPRVWRYASVALPGTFNLVVFGARRLGPFLEPPRGRRWPGVLAARDARAPHEVLGLMRHVGRPRQTHPAYRAWREGRPCRLAEPVRFPLSRP